jgi:hypothetical protein
MNILQYSLMVSISIYLIVMRKNQLPMQSHAASAVGDKYDDDYKITINYENSVHKDGNSKSDSTKQHLHHILRNNPLMAFSLSSPFLPTP